jgi:ribosomal protein S18 acetylase RimI-like enzyme
MSDIVIRLPTSTERKDQVFIKHVTELVNDAYNETETESKLYKPGQLRTNDAEISDWLASESFHLVFKRGAKFPIGSVRVHKVSSSVADIGVLAVHRDARSLGLGRRLVSHAEAVAVADGAKVVRLELLFPMPPQTNEFKNHLRGWYESLGYKTVGKASIIEIVPQLVDSLEDNSEFLIMEKVL